MKKKSIISLMCINILLVLVLFFFFLRIEKNEYYYFLGNENITVSDIRKYIQDDERKQNIQARKDKLKDSGYESSGDFYITKKVIEDIFPIFIVVLFVEAIVYICFIYVNKKDIDQKERLIKENLELLDRNQNLEMHLINDKEQMKQYEENLYHQLKTPLTGLKLCLETLKVDSNNRDSIDMALLEADKMSDLITLFLKDRKMSANQIRFNFEEQDCVLVVQEAIETVKPVAIKKNKTIRLQTELKSLIIKCDETWLRESFITLLENAVEHGKDDSTIMIRKQGQSILFEIVTKRNDF